MLTCTSHGGGTFTTSFLPKGGQIKPHTDGTLYDPVTATPTTHSVIIYINSNESNGGATEFSSQPSPEWRHAFEKLDEVKPEAGKALIFQHQLPHQGAVVEDGTKIILRMDMY